MYTARCKTTVFISSTNYLWLALDGTCVGQAQVHALQRGIHSLSSKQ